jgi:hypothetical protein
MKGEEIKNQKPPSARGFSGFAPPREEGWLVALSLCGVLSGLLSQGQRRGAAFFFVSKGGGCREDESLGFLPFRRLQGEEGFLGLGFFFCWLPFPL